MRVVNELGIDVIVPPLHHRVVTARVRVNGSRSARPGAGAARARAASLERRYPATPAGLGVTVSWGLPYFRRVVPKLADGRRYPAYLPVDTRRRRQKRKRRCRPCSTRCDSPATAVDVVLGADDVVFLLRSDQVAHLDDAYERCSAGSATSSPSGASETDSSEAGSRPGPGLAKQMALAAGVPGADLIVDGVQMFLGFTSTQKAAMAPDRIASFETLQGMTDQTPRSSGAAAPRCICRT